jgi:hypothetical protein
MSGIACVLCGLTENDFVPLTQLLELAVSFLKPAQIIFDGLVNDFSALLSCDNN